ncbi:MAG TPA: SDR family NAD(P)-dependent oxidoreductase [Vicinamibacterales bacterium]|nr:SDR family NAD(P)-dependent oxidoreductase [Vicinamibacterales bacterium]
MGRTGGMSYRSRAVLVVGGLGFIGGRLSGALADAGAKVTIVTPSRQKHPETAIDLEARGIRVLEGDVRDRGQMDASVRGQDVIFNLAGQSGAVRSMEEPWDDLDVNARGMLTLVEAVRRENPKARLVFTGSRLEYGHVGSAPVPETHDTDPLCVHAVHKLLAEQYLKLYERLYGISYAVARITNPYGPGQPRSRTAYGVVNRLIHLALAGESLPIYGDGGQRRDYLYIDDAVDALMLLGSRASAGRIYNVGTGVGTSFLDMAKSIVAAAGGGRIEFVPWPALAEKIETGDFVADVARIRADLGWTPAVGVDEGLRRTVAFYRAHVAQ